MILVAGFTDDDMAWDPEQRRLGPGEGQRGLRRGPSLVHREATTDLEGTLRSASFWTSVSLPSRRMAAPELGLPGVRVYSAGRPRNEPMKLPATEPAIAPSTVATAGLLHTPTAALPNNPTSPPTTKPTTMLSAMMRC